MSGLELFQNANFAIRTVTINGEPWFVASDICAAIEIGNTSQAVSYLDDDESTLITNEGHPFNVISESGLYSLILRSRKPQAKAFKRWVTHEVLPAIRKTGTYTATPRFEIPETLADALQLAADLARTNQQQREALDQALPKAQAWEEFIDAEGLYSMNDAAKILGVGRNRMMAELRNLGILQRVNLPYQRYADRFEVVAQTYCDRNGVEHVTAVTRVKPESLDWLARKLGTIDTPALRLVGQP